MKATYYCIKQIDNNSIVLEGIIRNAEDTIHPSQESGIDELPYECELHHFKADGYKAEYVDIDISRTKLLEYAVGCRRII